MIKVKWAAATQRAFVIRSSGQTIGYFQRQ